MNVHPIRPVAISIDWGALLFTAIGLGVITVGVTVVRRADQSRSQQALGAILFLIGMLIIVVRIR